MNGFLQDRKYQFALAVLALGYLLAMFIPIMGIDATQYAAMSYQMSLEGNYLEVFDGDRPYLDKPPLIFWLSSLTIGLFGNSTFAYKIPSVLALLLAAWSIRGYTTLMLDRVKGNMAALVLLSSVGIIIMAHDCRTDNLLVGFCCLAIWKIHAFNRHGKWNDLLFTALAIACALMAKGPLAVIFTGCVFGGNILFSQEKLRITWKWFLMALLIALFLVPMSLGLYTQHGMEGLRFFYWTQSFGRITGENPWENNPQAFFLLQTFLWTIIPYTLLFIGALASQFRGLIASKRKPAEVGTSLAFVLLMLALSQSKYQLSHYAYIMVPLAAVQVASFLELVNENRTWKTVQLVLGSLLVLLSIGAVLAFHESYWLIVPVLCFVLFLVLRPKDVLGTSVLSMALVSVLMYTLFFPALLKYQAYSEVAFDLREMGVDPQELMVFEDANHAIAYYNHPRTKHYWQVENVVKDSSHIYLFTKEIGKEKLETIGMPVELVKEYDHFTTQLLNIRFLNPETREGELQKRYLYRRTLE